MFEIVAFGLGFELLYLKRVDRVPDLALVTHTVRVGGIHVGAVQHPGVNFLGLLLPAVESCVLKHFGLLQEFFDDRVVVLSQTVACLVQPEVGGLSGLLGRVCLGERVVLRGELLDCACLASNPLIPGVMIGNLNEFLAIH